MTQINPIVFYWAMYTSPKAPLPSFYNNSKSLSLISRWARAFLLSFAVINSFGDYYFIVGLLQAISIGASEIFFFLNSKFGDTGLTER